MREKLFVKTIIATLLIAQQTITTAQETGLRSQSVSVFIDCDNCDLDHIKREITWVNYVREPKEADIHLLITGEQTGAGGSKVSLFFIGQKKFKEQNDTVSFINLPDDTQEIIRERMVSKIKVGLLHYVKQTPLADYIAADVLIPEESEEVVDKWNNWVFRLSTSGYANGNKNFRQYNIWSSVSANKITEKFKSETYFSNNYSESNFNYDDYSYKSINRSYSFNHQDIFSLTQHWSTGYWFGGNSSTYSNLKYGYYLYPAIEYSLFPYRESTRKQLRVNYSAGPSQRHYNDTTIFNKLDELLWKQNVNLAAEFVQQWGRVWLYATYSNYLHDFSLNRLDFNTSVSLRLLKGLEFYVYAGYSIIHDQIGLPKGEASQEELLLQQRELKTDYSFWANAGLTYTFGNLYNNVVNPRFGN
jgi:hypothetical protein